MDDTADLHMHSFHSDGVASPTDLAALARAAGLRAVSLTDHDTMAGWAEYEAACRQAGLEAIPGVELSARSGEREAHILGYCVDARSDALLDALEVFRSSRERRAEQMVDRLHDLGIPLTMEEVRRVAGLGAIGRPHVAEALVKAGLVTSYNEAFRRYLRVGCPAYVAKVRLDVDEAVEIIHGAGGLAVLAHPSTHFQERDISRMTGQGLDGLEVTHPRHSPEETRRFSEIGVRNGLFLTGGSDYHGGARGEAEVGRPRVSYDLVAIMKERL